ncbi:hypothetical protein GQF61_13145 [Sphingobacterium sp. DK4209]|uniref:Phosphatidylserine decarboxylase n=1 Tax=Sphingobacterium zhuxiongii TaxID=2662364 RepID=A0A5Q0QEM6_9SPHI|nr:MULTISPECIES: phosphatidylserine decarboxylase [unclassified Sphingobacterium]MVZ66802.1 hypothetical protein [Sphingobacterium sp. DK4209]QGA28036.1 hypothetical protein GFH32_17615 [Sphingobacterium sp. dk4302]
MRFHKEGYTSLALVLLFFFIVSAFAHYYEAGSLFKGLIYILFGMLFLVVLYFFRSPTRIIKQDPSQIYAPSDGTIASIDEIVDENNLEHSLFKISITISALNVRLTRAPISGTAFTNSLEFHGKFRQSIKSNNEIDVVVEHDGNFWKGPVFYNQKMVNQGDVIGSIKFGSSVDLYFPATAVLVAKKGDTIRAGETMLAKI